MIDYNKIKETLRSGIWDHLGVFFVDLENGDPRPDMQEGIDTFVSHKITAPYIEGPRHEVNDGEILTHTSLPTMTVSLTVYSSDKSNALSMAHGLRQWFRFVGYDLLKDGNLVVQSIENMDDRTTFLETEYDNRIGFDVIFRVHDEQTRTISTIETVQTNDKPID